RVFTGAPETARSIHLELARRPGPIVPLIAETGGQNAMIVDSSALAEQVVADLLASAFDSAGQRCSAARLLYVQTDIAERLLAMLAGAMGGLAIGGPALVATHVGPVIDAPAKEAVGRRAAPEGGERRAGEAGSADGARGSADLSLHAAGQHRARHLFRAASLRDRPRGAAHGRGVRPDPPRRALAGRPPRGGHRRDRRDRLRPHPRHPQPD